MKERRRNTEGGREKGKEFTSIQNCDEN